MSKIDFKDLVSELLVEQEPQQQDTQQATTNTPDSQWFNSIIDDFNRIQKENINVDKLKEIFQKAAKQNLSKEDIKAPGLQYVFILELLHMLWAAIPNHTNIKTWEDFVSKLNDGALQDIGTKIKNKWNVDQNQPLSIENLSHVDIQRHYKAAMNEIASLGEKALEGDGELSNSNVIDAVQKIVNRRIGVFTRMAKLKSPTQPFTNLINDIFKTPELYLTGSKKYTSDFAAVDKLYIQDLIKVAMAAKEFYAAEIVKRKTSSAPQTPSASQAAAPEPINTSLNLYDKFVNSVLAEMALTTQSQIGGAIASGARSPVGNYTVMGTKEPGGEFSKQQFDKDFDQKLKQAGQEPESQQQPEQPEQQKQLNPSVIKQLKDKALQDVPNRIRLLSGQEVTYVVVDDTGKDTQQTGTINSSNEYNIGSILKIQTPESQKLIDALGAIAQYTKTRPGAGEVAGKTLQGLGALSVGMGPVN